MCDAVAPTLGVCLEICRPDKLCILSDGDLSLADRERPLNADLVYRLFRKLLLFCFFFGLSAQKALKSADKMVLPEPLEMSTPWDPKEPIFNGE